MISIARRRTALVVALLYSMLSTGLTVDTLTVEVPVSAENEATAEPSSATATRKLPAVSTESNVRSPEVHAGGFVPHSAVIAPTKFAEGAALLFVNVPMTFTLVAAEVLRLTSNAPEVCVRAVVPAKMLAFTLPATTAVGEV